MNVEQAYEVTMAAIEELKTAGIDVELKPSNSRDDPDIVDKFNTLVNIKPDKWYNVCFTVSTPEQLAAISEKTKFLRKQGISFDTGGFTGYRDWEIDWSFTCSDTTEVDTEQELLDDVVEQLIAKIQQVPDFTEFIENVQTSSETASDDKVLC